MLEYNKGQVDTNSSPVIGWKGGPVKALGIELGVSFCII